MSKLQVVCVGVCFGGFRREGGGEGGFVCVFFFFFFFFCLYGPVYFQSDHFTSVCHMLCRVGLVCFRNAIPCL